MSITLLLSRRDELAAQLAAHDAVLAEARKTERTEAIAKLQAMMVEHGITVADLGSKSQAKRIAAQSAPKAKAPIGKTYQFGAVTYTTGKPGKPPAAYTSAKAAGTLDQHRVESAR